MFRSIEAERSSWLRSQFREGLTYEVRTTVFSASTCYTRHGKNKSGHEYGTFLQNKTNRRMKRKKIVRRKQEKLVTVATL
ncbi:uncharacterized protein LOC143145602 isoform X2 [Ptiloglossa arizonensis]|uniref:uncharacterized protein LOC143145602 isoform X2 n=1 Tax=Ptiloglossa arizonensis TaxID=3350558 RepID=UPI003F9F4304